MSTTVRDSKENFALDDFLDGAELRSLKYPGAVPGSKYKYYVKGKNSVYVIKICKKTSPEMKAVLSNMRLKVRKEGMHKANIWTATLILNNHNVEGTPEIDALLTINSDFEKHLESVGALSGRNVRKNISNIKNTIKDDIFVSEIPITFYTNKDTDNLTCATIKGDRRIMDPNELIGDNEVEISFSIQFSIKDDSIYTNYVAHELTIIGKATVSHS